MTIDKNDLLNSILTSLDQMDYIRSMDLPGIELYMDQVTTFMDGKLETSKRHQDDKILTKTMINNYAKNNLLPPPVKKKYSKEHLLTLIFIYYFKNIMSINDIQAVLNPLTDHYFGGSSAINLSQIYEEVFRLEPQEIAHMKEDLTRKYQESHSSFSSAPDKDKEFLQMFSFICMLSFDVYVKKQVIERLVDTMFSPSQPDPHKKKEDHKKEERKHENRSSEE